MAVSAGHAARVMQSRAWYNLVPDFDHSVVTAGYGAFNNTNRGGGNDYVTAARTGDGRLVTAYVPSTGSGTRTLTVNMARLTVNPVTAKWFNPASGTYTTIGSFANTGSRTFTTLGNNGQSMNDWLLTLEPDHASYARARRSPLPGRTSGPAVDQGSRDTETVKGDALDTPWIDPNYSQDALSQGGFTGQQWAQLGVTTLVWLVAPLIIGIRALIRSEVK